VIVKNIFYSAFLTILIVGFSFEESHASDNNDLNTEISIKSISDPVKNIIIDQLKALKEKDANLAYSNLSEKSKKKYKNADNYLLQVKRDMRTLYFNSHFEFISGWKIKGKEVRKLEITSDEGDVTTAIFKLIKLDNNLWAIDGTVVLSGEDMPI